MGWGKGMGPDAREMLFGGFPAERHVLTKVSRDLLYNTSSHLYMPLCMYIYVCTCNSCFYNLNSEQKYLECCCIPNHFTTVACMCLVCASDVWMVICSQSTGVFLCFVYQVLQC